MCCAAAANAASADVAYSMMVRGWKPCATSYLCRPPAAAESFARYFATYLATRRA
jgi:hypothetical protein